LLIQVGWSNSFLKLLIFCVVDYIFKSFAWELFLVFKFITNQQFSPEILSLIHWFRPLKVAVDQIFPFLIIVNTEKFLVIIDGIPFSPSYYIYL